MKGKIIKSALKIAGIQMQDMAKKLNISREHFSRMLTTEMPEEYVEKIKGFGINIDLGKKESSKAVPYYDIDATAGNVTIFAEDGPEYIKSYIDVPAFSDCEMFIGVSGDSMYPKYCSGELIALKKISDRDSITWKEAHLVVTKEQRLLKYIMPGKDLDHWTLNSENKKHPPMIDFPRKKVLHLYIVKGKITKNII